VGEDAAQRGHPARLVEEDVRGVAENHLLAPRAVGEDAGGVAHRAAHDEERRLHSQPLGRHRLKTVDRGVLAEDVVAEIGAKDGLAHGLRGQGYGIASQIDDGHRQPPMIHGVLSRGCETALYRESFTVAVFSQAFHGRC
jgi:hypothetical protein